MSGSAGVSGLIGSQPKPLFQNDGNLHRRQDLDHYVHTNQSSAGVLRVLAFNPPSLGGGTF